MSISTNIIEGSFSIFKRGMRGVYQHRGKKHLHRYLAEFDFRYSNRAALGLDHQERADRALAHRGRPSLSVGGGPAGARSHIETRNAIRINDLQVVDSSGENRYIRINPVAAGGKTLSV